MVEMFPPPAVTIDALSTEQGRLQLAFKQGQANLAALMAYYEKESDHVP